MEVDVKQSCRERCLNLKDIEDRAEAVSGLVSEADRTVVPGRIACGGCKRFGRERDTCNAAVTQMPSGLGAEADITAQNILWPLPHGQALDDGLGITELPVMNVPSE